MIGIIDYGMGNLASVSNALKALDLEHVISSDPKVLEECDRLIFPGVGAMADCMANLKSKGLDEWIKQQALVEKKPLLGICLGMQALLESSEENGGVQCLGLLKGVCRRMDDPDVRIPQIGWNALDLKQGQPLAEVLPEQFFVYYDHSYYGTDMEADAVMGTSAHGRHLVPGLVGKDNILGCQFHPEKSAETGLRILKYFGKEMKS